MTGYCSIHCGWFPHWDIIKHKTGEFHLTEQIPSPPINDEKVKDSELSADAFSTSFLTMTENLN
jgi:hypothetical protein